jgi:hypothetical protein
MSGRSVAIFAVVGLGALAYLGGIRTHLDPARMYAPGTGALKAIQTLITAQVQCNSQFGRYAGSLAELGPSGAGLISTKLAGGEAQGYKFDLRAAPTGYAITAAPSKFCGSRTFHSDQSLVVRENYGPEPATSNSKRVGK